MEILIYIILWYTVGVVSMYGLQYLLNAEYMEGEHDIYNKVLVGNNEVWVLGLCGVLVPAVMIWMFLSVCYDEWKSKQ